MFQNKLCGYYGNEDLHTEFKEFCLKMDLDIFMEDEDIENILIEKKWDPNLSRAIHKSIDLYLTNVLRKYICSFSNSRIDGKFIIGVDDYGEITGIPFMGSLNKKQIEKTVMDTIGNLAFDENGSQDTQNKNLLSENVKIDIDKLDIDPILIVDEHSDLYEKYKRDCMENNHKMQIYKKKRLIWLMELDKYSTKLSTLINSRDIRDDIIEYINKVSVTKLKIAEENKLHILPGAIDKIKDKLKSDHYISVPAFAELQIQKVDPNNVMYWLVQFKDDITNEICKERPAKPSLKRQYYPRQIVSKLSCMRALFSNIPGLNYYTITVAINGSVFDKTDKTLYYKDGDKMIYKVRKVTEDGDPYSE